jgi:Tol biopolymer transport system component
MKRLTSRHLSAVVFSFGLAACSASSIAPTSGPSEAARSLPSAVVVTSASPLTAASPTLRPIASPLMLPSEGRILFTTEPGAGNRIFFIDPTGLHEIPTDVPDTTLAHALWAPSDSIIFDSERDVRRHVFRMGLDGQDIVELTSGDAIQERPAVSSDGSTIAYADFVDRPLGADLGLHLANADGTKSRALTKGGKGGVNAGDTSPSFSPDGRWVAFERAVDFDTGKAGLFVIRSDGTGLRRLTDDALGAGYPRWSPDGKRILFTQHNDTTTFSPGPLWVVDVAGGAPRPVTDPNDPGISFSGDWSPSGRQIAYVYYRPGWDHNELRIVNADGTNLSTLWQPAAGDGGGAESPDWGN